jgi:hypothetical protein
MPFGKVPFGTPPEGAVGEAPQGAEPLTSAADSSHSYKKTRQAFSLAYIERM